MWFSLPITCEISAEKNCDVLRAREWNFVTYRHLYDHFTLEIQVSSWLVYCQLCQVDSNSFASRELTFARHQMSIHIATSSGQRKSTTAFQRRQQLTVTNVTNSKGKLVFYWSYTVCCGILCHCTCLHFVADGWSQHRSEQHPTTAVAFGYWPHCVCLYGRQIQPILS